MVGIVLRENRENERALPYLEKYKNSDDTFMFTFGRLMECYASLGKIQKAEEVYRELEPLIDDKDEKEELRNYASRLGLNSY